MRADLIEASLLDPKIQRMVESNVDFIMERCGSKEHDFSKFSFHLCFIEDDEPDSLGIVVLRTDKRKGGNC